MCAPARTATHDETMLKYGMHQLFDVVRNDVAAVLDHGQGLRCSEQRSCPPRADAEFDFGVLARPVHKPNHVIENRVVNVDLVALILKRENLGTGQYGLCPALLIAVRERL